MSKTAISQAIDHNQTELVCRIKENHNRIVRGFFSHPDEYETKNYENLQFFIIKISSMLQFHLYLTISVQTGKRKGKFVYRINLCQD